MIIGLLEMVINAFTIYRRKLRQQQSLKVLFMAITTGAWRKAREKNFMTSLSY